MVGPPGSTGEVGRWCRAWPGSLLVNFFYHWCWMGVKCRSGKLFHIKLWKPCLHGPEWAFLKLLQHSWNTTIKMTSYAPMLWFSLIGTSGPNPNHGKQPQSRNTQRLNPNTPLPLKAYRSKNTRCEVLELGCPWNAGTFFRCTFQTTPCVTDVFFIKRL